jgi:hypothetical protein
MEANFRNPDFEPSDAEHAALMERFRRVVLWRQAMAARGIKVLAVAMTPAEETAAVLEWWAEEGHAQYSDSAAPIAAE